MHQGSVMENFIRNENLKLYRQALAGCSDPKQRQVLTGLLDLLLAEEAALPSPAADVAPTIPPVMI